MGKLTLFFSLSIMATCFASVVQPLDPKVTGSQAGDAVAVWSQFSQTNFAIQQAFFPFGGSWSAPAQASEQGKEAFLPRVAMNDTEQILFVWQGSNGSYFLTQSAFTIFGTDATTSTEVSHLPSLPPKVGIDDDGNGAAIWQENTSVGSTVSAATYSISYGWNKPTQLASPTNSLKAPDLAVHSTTGDIVAVWQERVDGSTVIQSSALPFGSCNWSEPVIISSSGAEARNPSVIYGVSGEALAAWQIPTGSFIAFQVSSFSANLWSEPVTLAIPERHLVHPQLALDASGHAILVGESHKAQESLVVAAVRTPQGNWGNFEIISIASEINAIFPQIAINSAHQAIAAWESGLPGQREIRVALFTLLGGWSPPLTLSLNNLNNASPSLWMNNAGYAIVVWQASNGSQNVVQASALPSFGGTWTLPQTISN